MKVNFYIAGSYKGFQGLGISEPHFEKWCLKISFDVIVFFTFPSTYVDTQPYC